MNDDVFNTVAAVALMCGSHLMSGGTLDNNFIPISGTYKPGFEKCAAIVAIYRAETQKREKQAAKQEEDREKARVANALAALHGEKFTPETALPKLMTPCSNWVIPAGTFGTQDDAVVFHSGIAK